MPIPFVFFRHVVATVCINLAVPEGYDFFLVKELNIFLGSDFSHFLLHLFLHDFFNFFLLFDFAMPLQLLPLEQVKLSFELFFLGAEIFDKIVGMLVQLVLLGFFQVSKVLFLHFWLFVGFAQALDGGVDESLFSKNPVYVLLRLDYLDQCTNTLLKSLCSRRDSE